MRHDFIDRYARRDTPVSRLDPRTRIAGALAACLTAVLAQPGKPWPLVPAAAFALCWAATARVPVGWLLTRSASVLPFVLLAGMWNPLLRSGPEGWLQLGLLTARAVISAMAMVLLASTTRFPLLLKGLYSLGLPRAAGTVLSFTYRFLFVLVEEGERLEMAVRSRAPHRRGRFRALAGAAGYLFLRTYERAERVYRAMLARGFTGTPPAGDRLRLGAPDLAGLAVVVLFLALAWVPR